jgi:hypothetical protein
MLPSGSASSPPPPPPVVVGAVPAPLSRFLRVGPPSGFFRLCVVRVRCCSTRPHARQSRQPPITPCLHLYNPSWSTCPTFSCRPLPHPPDQLAAESVVPDTARFTQVAALDSFCFYELWQMHLAKAGSVFTLPFSSV